MINPTATWPHLREEGSGLKAARIVNTQAAQDPACESRIYKKNAAASLDEQCLEEEKSLQEAHHNLTIEAAPTAWAARSRQQDRVVSGSDQSRTQRERTQRYPFAGAGQQQSGQLREQGQGQLQIGAPLPRPTVSMLCLIVVLNQWRAIRRTSRCFGFCGSRAASEGWAASAAGRSSGRMGCFGSRCSCNIPSSSKSSSVCSLHGIHCLC